MTKIFRITAIAGVLLVLCSLPLQGQDLGLAPATEQLWRGTQAGSRAGASVIGGAVSRGDSRRDLIVGAPGGPGTAGDVYVIFGGPQRSGEISLTQAHVHVLGAAAGDEFGAATAAGNVLNTQGAIPRNLVIGAPGSLGGRGAVYLFSAGFAESTTLTAANAVFTVFGAPGDRLGEAILTGDLDNDTYREIIIGAPGTGKVYIIRGSPTLSGTLDLSVSAPDFTITGGGIGRSIAVGDLSGDGVFDLVMGSPAANSVYIVNGTASGGFRIALAAHLTGIDLGDEAGSAVHIANIDGDGRNDLVVTAPGGDGPDNSRVDAGEVYVVWGAAVQTASLASAGLTIFGANASGRAGTHINTGDINRDIPNDIVLLAVPGINGGGDAYLFYGASRSRLGVLLPDGRRVVDLANGADRRILGDPAIGVMGDVLIFEVTGEGANDVVIGVPGESTAGAVRVTLSPKLELNQHSISATVLEGASISRSLTVTNISPISITWAASRVPSWITLSAMSGEISGVQPAMLSVQVSAASLPPGSHTATFSIASASRHLEMTRNVTVSVLVPRSRYLEPEVPAFGLRLPSTFVLSGWAADTAAAAGSGITDIHVTAIAGNGNGAGFALGMAQHGLARPDVASNLGTGFLNSGFLLQVANLPAGVYRFVLTARSAATGSSWTRVVDNVTVVGASRVSATDLNRDGMSDLIWQHTDGRVSTWMMNGTALLEGRLLTPASVDTAWKIVGTGDVNRDGILDLFWHHRFDGRVSVWLMNGTVLAQGIVIARVPDLAWSVAGVGDLNQDGWPDLVWRNSGDGMVSTWLMNGTSILDFKLLTPARVPDLNWRIAGVADMNEDGRADLVWRNVADGRVSTWLMAGTVAVGFAMLSPDRVALDWDIGALADLNGDGSTDLVWRHRTHGWVSAWLMNGTSAVAMPLLQPAAVADPGWKIVGPR